MKKLTKIISVVLIFTVLSLNIIWPTDASACPWWGGTQGSDTTLGAIGKALDSFYQLAKGLLSDGDPITLFNGNYSYETKDLAISSRGLNIEFKRHYRSRSRYNNRFGFGWDMNYNQRIVPLNNGDIEYLDGELERLTFKYIDGTNYISPAGVYDVLVQNPNGTFTLTKPQGTKYEFDVYGCLAQIIDRNNNAIGFHYDPAGLTPIFGISPYSNDPTPKIIAYDYKLVQITDPVGRNINLSYDASGHLIGITDFADRTYTYSYDTSGNGDLISFTTPQTTEYPAGLTTTYGYDNKHRLTTITDAKNQTYLTNRYDSSDRVYEQDYGSGTFHFTYDTVNKKTTVTDPKGFITEWIYNNDGAPVSKKEFTANLRVADPDYYTTVYTHNNDLERTSVTYPKGSGIKYTFDEGNPDPQAQGNLLEIRRKANMSQPDDSLNDIVTAFTYEPNFNLVKTITDPKGNVTTFNYDANGNLVAIIYPEISGQIPQTLFTYNSFGQVETVTDPNNNLTRYEYYPDTGYLKKIIQDQSGINAITQFTYDAYGNIASVINANNKTTVFVYNPLNQLIQQTDPLGYKTKYSYDQNGNLTKIQRQANTAATSWQTTQYAYTILDQLQTITDPLNHTTTFTYDLNGNRSSITDANNKITSYQFDERNLIWKATDANTPAGITEYAYDGNANLSVIKDAKAQETTYAYDNFDRLLTTTYADSSYAQYTYDKNSNLAQSRNPNTETIIYAYDALNRLDLKTYPDVTTVDYGYDLGSRLTSVDYGPSTIDYSYDALNRISSATNTLNSTPYTLTYNYDKLGNRTKLTYPSGTVLDYFYDGNNALSGIRKDNQGLVQYSYDILGRRIRKDLRSSKIERSAYTYDLANQLISLKNYIYTSGGGGGMPRKIPVDNGGYLGSIKQLNTDVAHLAALSVKRLRNSLRLTSNVNRQNYDATVKPTDDTSSATLRRSTQDGKAHSSFLSPFHIPDAEASGLPLLNSQFSYTYDNVGNRLKMTAPNGVQNYAYNNIDK